MGLPRTHGLAAQAILFSTLATTLVADETRATFHNATEQTLRLELDTTDASAAAEPAAGVRVTLRDFNRNGMRLVHQEVNEGGAQRFVDVAAKSTAYLSLSAGEGASGTTRFQVTPQPGQAKVIYTLPSFALIYKTAYRGGVQATTLATDLAEQDFIRTPAVPEILFQEEPCSETGVIIHQKLRTPPVYLDDSFTASSPSPLATPKSERYPEMPSPVAFLLPPATAADAKDPKEAPVPAPDPSGEDELQAIDLNF